jgi:hypothetical protein
VIRGVFFPFAVHYTAYNDIKDNFVVDSNVLNEFKKFIKTKDVEVSKEDWTQENIDFVKTGIKREVFRKVMGTKGAYIAALPEDEEFQKVLGMFKDRNTLSGMFEYVEERIEISGEDEEISKGNDK